MELNKEIQNELSYVTKCWTQCWELINDDNFNNKTKQHKLNHIIGLYYNNIDTEENYIIYNVLTTLIDLDLLNKDLTNNTFDLVYATIHSIMNRDCVFETNDKNDNLETLLHYRISELHKKHNITFYTEYNSLENRYKVSYVPNDEYDYLLIEDLIFEFQNLFGDNAPEFVEIKEIDTLLNE